MGSKTPPRHCRRTMRSCGSMRSADGTLDDIAVDLNAAVVEEADEAVPMAEAVADVISDGRPPGDAGELLFQPWLQFVRERFAACLSFGTALIGRPAADVGLDLKSLPIRISASSAIGALPPFAMS